MFSSLAEFKEIIFFIIKVWIFEPIKIFLSDLENYLWALLFFMKGQFQFLNDF